MPLIVRWSVCEVPSVFEALNFTYYVHHTRGDVYMYLKSCLSNIKTYKQTQITSVVCRLARSRLALPS